MATKNAKPKKKAVKKKPAKPKFSPIQLKFLDALKGNLGIISKAADEVNIHRNTHYLWMRTNEAYAAEVEAIENDCIDVVENALMNNILAGDVASIIFYLKTKAKARGFIEKTEVDNNTTLKVAQPIIIDWNGSDNDTDKAS